MADSVNVDDLAEATVQTITVDGVELEIDSRAITDVAFMRTMVTLRKQELGEELTEDDIFDLQPSLVAIFGRAQAAKVEKHLREKNGGYADFGQWAGFLLAVLTQLKQPKN